MSESTASWRFTAQTAPVGWLPQRMLAPPQAESSLPCCPPCPLPPAQELPAILAAADLRSLVRHGPSLPCCKELSEICSFCGRVLQASMRLRHQDGQAVLIQVAQLAWKVRGETQHSEKVLSSSCLPKVSCSSLKNTVRLKGAAG